MDVSQNATRGLCTSDGLCRSSHLSIRGGVTTNIELKTNAQHSTIILHKPEDGSYEIATLVKNENKERKRKKSTSAVYYILASLSPPLQII